MPAAAAALTWIKALPPAGPFAGHPRVVSYRRYTAAGPGKDDEADIDHGDGPRVRPRRRAGRLCLDAGGLQPAAARGRRHPPGVLPAAAADPPARPARDLPRGRSRR